MPIYDYKCEICGNIVEKTVNFNDPDPWCNHDILRAGQAQSLYPDPCPMKKIIGKTSFTLKGKWFKDGY